MSLFRSFVLFGALLAAGPVQADKPGNASIEEPDKEGVEQRLELFDNGPGLAGCKTKGKVCFKAGPGSQLEGGDAPTVSRRNGAKGDWVLELFGNFKKSSLAGNAQFMFSDVADSKAAKKRDLTSLQQAVIKAGNGVSARVRLSGDDGFRTGRAYKVEIVQIISGQEVSLAEGSFTLK